MNEHNHYVYFLTNKHHTTLYIGTTRGLSDRLCNHWSGAGSSFVKRYNLDKLVYVERYDTAEEAVIREKQLKGWRRSKKNKLIESKNPDWRDFRIFM